MTPRLVMYLGIAALVSAGAAGAVWRAENAHQAVAESGDWLLPGLVDNVNAVAGIAVQAGEKSIELKRGEAGWTVAPSGYPVKDKKLRDVLVGLVRLTKLEPRTADAGKYEIIQVEDAAKPGAKARQVTLKDDKGAVTGSVILGKAATGFTTGNEEAQYVRLADDKQSWLVRGAVGAGGELKDWVDTAVMRVNTGEVKLVEFRHSDGDVLTLTKNGKDDKGNDRFEIGGLPEGVKPAEERTVRYGATDLANVEFTDVRKATAQATPVGEVMLESDKGLKVTYNVMEEGDQTWLSVKVVEKGSDAEAADKITARVDGWEFALADYKAKQFKKRLSDFLNMQE